MVKPKNPLGLVLPPRDGKEPDSGIESASSAWSTPSPKSILPPPPSLHSTARPAQCLFSPLPMPHIEAYEMLSLKLIKKLLAVINAGGQTKVGIPVTINTTDFKNIKIHFGKRLITLTKAEKLGSGAFGNVSHYKAQEVLCDIQSPVIDLAIKSYRAGDSDEETHETEAKKHERACKNDHPNIIKYAGHHQLIGSAGLLFMKLEEQSLRALIEKNTFKGNKKLIKIISGIISGLHHLGKRGLLHLDLKPANVLLTKELVPVLADLGCSRTWRHHASPRSSLYVGTFSILSPEIFTGSKLESNFANYQKQTDLWALGLIIKELLGLPLPTPETSKEKTPSEIERHSLYNTWAHAYQERLPTYIEESTARLHELELAQNPDAVWLNDLANCLLLPIELRPELADIINEAGQLDPKTDWAQYLEKALLPNPKTQYTMH